jgi:tyrosyl-tRNA synthetase
MNLEKRLELIRQVGEEIVKEDELRKLLGEKKHPIAYDGFEPSGNVHIAQGLLRAINVNKMTKAGCRFKMLVADWHGWANNKMGGDLDKIKTVGKYLMEVWKVAGMDLDKVEFVWVSDYVKDEEYWKKVMQIARNTTIKRIIRCGQIMGRKDNEVLQSSQILYPCMQAADIFYLEADICQLGMDQRKVNVLAREIGPKLGLWKPVIVSHHMLMGLTPPKFHLIPTTSAEDRTVELKMSKSIPDSSIFMTDPAKEVKRKISKAYCPPKIIRENPILEYMKYIIFERYGKVKIEREKKFGGDLEVKSYLELEKLYGEGEIHPLDLKNAASNYINDLLEPVRKHFDKNKKAKELLGFIKKQDVTR